MEKSDRESTAVETDWEAHFEQQQVIWKYPNTDRRYYSHHMKMKSLSLAIMFGITITVYPAVMLPGAMAQSNNDFFPYLGMTLDDKLSVVGTNAGSPAARAGLMRGDRIISIGDTSVQNIDHRRSVSLLRGELGSPVTLTLCRGRQVYRVTLVHEALRSGQIEPNRTRQSGPVSPGSRVDQSTQSTPSANPGNDFRTISSVPTRLEDLDKQMLVIIGNTDRTRQVVESVIEGLRLLPAAIKQRLIAFGVKVVVTPTHQQVTDEPGGTEYEPRYKRVVICEENTDGTPADLRRMPITTLHELGHAYDHMLDHPSRGAEFRGIYDSEAPLVPEEHRAILSHFLQPGNKGPSECFASLFACKYYRGDDRRLDALKDDFPKCFALMQRY